MKTIIGNLLDITSGTILHQVNCRGVVGGLAGALCEKYPTAFAEYFAACKANGFAQLGDHLTCKAVDGLFICHIFGQLNPGAATDMDAVNQALADAAISLQVEPVYAAYRMGCGIGGGNWRAYREELWQFFPELTIIRRPEDAR